MQPVVVSTTTTLEFLIVCIGEIVLFDKTNYGNIISSYHIFVSTGFARAIPKKMTGELMFVARLLFHLLR